MNDRGYDCVNASLHGRGYGLGDPTVRLAKDYKKLHPDAIGQVEIVRTAGGRYDARELPATGADRARYLERQRRDAQPPDSSAAGRRRTLAALGRTV
jgi:hypothetical protein